ncbi:GMC oxidoreductase [Gimibacter soli]|uniref:GMC family oxidoreductase n=1 Tax=Gimibacter soli TaxID=3024400 RepID=A0AAF0BMD0_9PROT|nr:GMC family oxidoreductase [Gimibacter soli]WCL54390.1 GMC family oxidoreductase [Gimibacter soli]
MAGQPEFDVIVVGSGISGGWAAKELTERGFKTLVIERGKNVEHGTDYTGEGKGPWETEFRDRVDRNLAESDYPIQSKCYAFKETTKHFFVNDRENPYTQEEGNPFTWIRGYHKGGKSVLWHRQSYRFGPQDFESNARDGYGSDWPIRYEDLAPWYDHVERFAGISGARDGVPQLPDGQFQPPIEMNCAEIEIQRRIAETYDDRQLIVGRCAHLTEPTEEQLELGRGRCQSRNQCQRGCSFGAYFSSLSATLPAAERTGNLTMLTDAIVHSVIHDPKSGRATGVRVINRLTKEKSEHHARVIFICASTIGSTQVLLNSTSEAFPNGFANSSGALGHYLMDHLSMHGAYGILEGFEEHYYKGRSPTGVYIPRFKNIKADDADFLRGYGFQGGASRAAWNSVADQPGVGADLKAAVRKPGPWVFHIEGYGEMLPRYENSISLNHNKLDQWGMPVLHIDCSLGDNDRKMLKDIVETSTSMLKAIGLKDVGSYSSDSIAGMAIHEMGTARMGKDPKDSVLNRYNQCHDVPNVFVTDGAAMASCACQNPSLTYMAITARAANYAADQMQAGLL